MAILRPTSTITLDTGWAPANGGTTAHGSLSDDVTQPADPSATARVDYTETPSVANRTVLVACAQTDVESGTLWVYGRKGTFTVRAEVRDDTGTVYGSVNLPSGLGSWVSVGFGAMPAGRTPRIAVLIVNGGVALTQAPRVWDAYLDVVVQTPAPDVTTTDADVKTGHRPSVACLADDRASVELAASHRPAVSVRAGAIPQP